MSKAGTSKNKNTEFDYSKVDENTFKNEKFPELEDQDYPKEFIQKLEAKAKETNEEQKKNHAVAPGSVTRKAHYQYRGPAYVHKHGGRGHYNRWPFDYLLTWCDDAQKKVMLEMVESLAQERPVWAIVKEKSKWKEHYEFPEPGSFPGKEKRFFLSTKRTRRTNPADYYFFQVVAPYQWQAHHLIPIEVFSGGGKEPRFTDKELEQIRLSGYDVNNGHNVVPVPTEEAAPHCLLLHSGGHIEYNKYASKKMDKVKDKIAEAVESGKPHDAFYPQLIKLLTEAEDDLWNQLKTLGKNAVTKFLQGEQPASKLVKFMSKRKNKRTGMRKQFPVGALA